MENLQEQLIDVDWADKIRKFQMAHSDEESIYSNDEIHFRQKSFDERWGIGIFDTSEEYQVPPALSIQNFCNPVSMQPVSMVVILLIVKQSIKILN